jgi:hypothetical protein
LSYTADSARVASFALDFHSPPEPNMHGPQRLTEEAPDSLKVDVYEHLFRINLAFDQVRRSLAALHSVRQFQAPELARFRRLCQETRASLNSYLTNVISPAETNEAGRRYGERLRQERKDEEGLADS